METIPADTLKAIHALRTENGLVATEAALKADLAKSKARWTLEETPRYRRAGRSPLYISGRYLTSAGVCPATGEADVQGASKAVKAVKRTDSSLSAEGKSVDEKAFYRVLHGKGFAVKLSQNLITEELETEVPAAITKLSLKFGAIPGNATDVHVTQTTPQVQISMSLDKFLELTGTKP